MKLSNTTISHRDTENTEKRRIIFTLVFLLIISGWVWAAEIEVIDADNNRYQGDRIVFDKEQCVLYKDITPTAIAYKDIVGITLGQAISGAVKSPLRLMTPTWDIIYGAIEGGERDKVIFNSPLLGSIRLPFSEISQIETAGFQQSVQEKRDEDILYLTNGDKDRGVIVSLDSQKLVFKSSLYNQEMTYKTGDIGCLKFSLIDAPRVSASYKPGVQVICRDGSLVSGDIFEAKPDQLHMDVFFKIPLSAMSFVYFRPPYNNRCVYLSDESPSVVKEYAWPFAQDEIFLWPYQPDRGVSENTPIRMKGRTYYKGLGVHANSELTYTLREKYKTFYAVIGLDDTAGDKASVQFAVYLDGKKVYESKVFRYGDAPEEIAVPIKDAGLLKLVVTDAGDGYIHDRAVWALARLTGP